MQNTNLQTIRGRALLFLFLLFYCAFMNVLASSGDSIYVKQYNKVRYYHSDSIFQKYAQSGYLSVIDDVCDYYEDIVDYLPTDRQFQEVSKIRQIAKKYNSAELDAEADYMHAYVLPVKSDRDIAYKVSRMQSVVNNADRQGNIIIKLRGMEAIFEIYWKYSQYAKAFSQVYLLDEELQKVTDSQYPEKGSVYFRIGQAFSFFNDYEKAMPYLRKALSPPKYYFDRSELLARNAIGEYYNSVGLIDSAEYYFRSAYFSAHNVKAKPILDAMSLGNIGQSLLKKKDYNNAISYLRAGLDRILMDNDYEFASDITLGLAKCYLAKDDYRRTKSLIDSTKMFIEKGDNLDLYQSLYPLMCDYYSRIGNSQLSVAYFDSTLMINKVYADKYNSLHILKAEQDLYESKSKAKDEEMRLKEENFKSKVFYGVIAILIISVGLLSLMVLYHKNRTAYRALVLKNRDWARDATSYDTYEYIEEKVAEAVDEPEESVVKVEEEKGEEPTKEDVALMKQVHELVTKDKIYKDMELTLDALAKRMNVNRNYLSKAINKTTNKNFNTYINEYRVKEAIKILSSKKADLMSIDAIAFDSGFNNRTSFYQSFKKITGLSPSDFRDNKPIEKEFEKYR